MIIKTPAATSARMLASALLLLAAMPSSASGGPAKPADPFVSCDATPTDTTPRGVHLTYTGGPAATEIGVSFFTCASGAGNPTVKVFGGDMHAPASFQGVSSSYYTRWQHNVLVDGLAPGTAYEYTVQFVDKGGDSRVSADAVDSAVFSFQTAPDAALAETHQLTALFVGDMGVNESIKTIDRMTTLVDRGVINLTVHVGDISYADDSNIGILEPSSGSSYENVYDYFQESIAPVAAHVPYMVAPGNHDVSCKAIGDNGCPKQQRNFTAFRKRFIMPSAPSGALDKQGRPVENMWYSFDVGGVHFVSISTETDFPHAPTNPTTIIGGGAGGGFGDQLAWLRKDLNKARSVNSTRFIVVYGHRPWYSTVTADWPFLAPLRVQEAFEPLFREARVDLYICGHKHLYERTVSAFDGERNDNDGTVQVINGAAGNNEGLQPGKGVGGLIVSANYKDHGFGSIEVIGDRLRWRYRLSETGDVYDEFFLESRRTK